MFTTQSPENVPEKQKIMQPKTLEKGLGDQWNQSDSSGGWPKGRRKPQGQSPSGG